MGLNSVVRMVVLLPKERSKTSFQTANTSEEIYVGMASGETKCMMELLNINLLAPKNVGEYLSMGSIYNVCQWGAQRVTINVNLPCKDV